MTRIRSIRPEIFDSDAYVRLSRDARRVLIELICLADDEGRLQGSARHLRAQRYAEDDDLTTAEIEGWIADVEREGWIRRYQVNGNTIAQVVGWSDYGTPTYQVVNRATPSRFPPPPCSVSEPGTLTAASPPPHVALTPASPQPHIGLSESEVSKPPPLTSDSDPPHDTLTSGSDLAPIALPSDSVTDQDQEEEEEEEDLSPSARTREPPVNPDVCGEREFLALWTEVAVGRAERIRDVLQLTGIERANLRRIGKPAAWWREVLGHVDRSGFLRGEERGWTLRTKWLLEDETGTNAHAVHAGQYDDRPPAGTVRTGTTAQALTAEQLARLTAFRLGWTKGAGTDGHVAPAEPPSARTSEADRVLVPLLERWAAQPDTAGWATSIGAEGAAAYLRGQVVSGKRRGVPDLAKLGRTPVELEEALRNGERYRKAPKATAAPTVSTDAAKPVSRPQRVDETPAATLVRLRAKADAGLASAEDRARITELERRISENRGDTVVVLDSDERAQRGGRAIA